MISDQLSQERVRAKNCIMGALVADAATMGFHWLYSQKKIRALAPVKPEFYLPAEKDYEGIGYFAHGAKVPGEFSHYGEQCLVMLNSLVEGDGAYNKDIYQKCFREHFGYGGEFSGYIDRPTKETLDNISRFENENSIEIDSLDSSRIFHGADDDQLPAVSKLPH